MKPSPEWIYTLNPNQIFVFGSNLAGRHGAGAALQAVTWGAKNGIGYGLSGQTFAIPTKDKNLKTLPLDVIKVYVEGFILVAKRFEFKENEFLVTNIGCGLAGYKVSDIAPFFQDAMNYDNIRLPEKFIIHINSIK